MLISCPECKKTYRLDPALIQAAEARFACKQCGHVITAVKPSDGAIPPGKPTQSVPAPGDRPANDPGPDRKETSSAAAGGVAPNTLVTSTIGMGLTAKVIMQMLAVSLVPLLIFWGSTAHRTSQRVEADFKALAQEITTGLVSQVDEWIDKNVRVMNAFARLPAMVSMVPSQQEILLETMSKEYPWIYLAFTTDTTGMNIARSDGKPLKDYSDRQYYQEAIAQQGLAWQNLIGKTSKKPALVLATPIKNGEIVVGVLAIAMRIDTISKRIATWRQGETGHAFLVDESGKVVAHQLEAYVIGQENLGEHELIRGFKNGVQEMQNFVGPQGQPMIGQARATEYGWVLAIEQSEKEAFDVLRQERRFAFILLTATIVFVVLFALFVGRRIVTPIRELTLAADRISVGDLDVVIDIKSKDEIAALGNAITRMQDSIRLSIKRLRRRR